jgi:uncharacterized delta-60 repeat protein
MSYWKPRALAALRLLAVLGGMAASGFLPELDAQASWTVEPSSTQADLWGACATPVEGVVAVGTGGTIVATGDGTKWVLIPSGTTNWLLGVASGTGEFVVVGDAGIILSSPNLENWTQQTVGTARLNGVAYGNGIWLAVGEGGAVARSTAQSPWTAGNAGVSGFLRGVTYRADLGLFVVTGQGGVILTTPDGLTFKTVAAGTNADIECVAVGDSPLEEVVAGSNGYLASSAGGAIWAPLVLASSTHFRGCVVPGRTAITVGSAGTILVTDLGSANTQAASTGVTGDLYAAATGNDGTGKDYAVAVGQGGLILRAPLANPILQGGIATSAFEPSLGNTVTLSVNAVGQAPFTYQWSFNAVPLSGATGATLVLPNLQADENGTYSVVVSNAVGSATAQIAVNAVYEPGIPGLVDESFNPKFDPPQGFFYLNPHYATSAALQADGKVLIEVPGLTRLNPDGTPDVAFAAASQDADIRGGITGITVQADGRILVFSHDPGGLIGRGPSDWSIRLNSDGSTDTSYTPEAISLGVVETQDAIPQVELQDGRYLASKYGKIVRLTTAGAVDTTFTPTSSIGTSYVLDLSGRVIVGGGPVVFRLNPDGTPDSSFAVFNASLVLPGGSVAGVFLQPNGKIVYVVVSASAPPFGYAVGRVNADGTPDPSYPGVRVASGINSVMGATAMTPDGSLWLDVIDGIQLASATLPVPTIDGHYHNGIVRIDPDGNFDATYSLNVEGINFAPGSADLAMFPGPVALNGILPTPSGQWYVCGSFVSFNGEPRIGIVRINPQVGAQFSKLGNISARALAGSGAQTLIVGFVTQGATDMSMLLRGVGPGLASFDVPGVLPDPQLALFDASSVLQLSNNNWQDGGDGPAIAAADTNVGAFALANGSRDAAALAQLKPGSHSFEVFQPGGTTGVALAEAYDANTASPTFSAPRAINFSCRSTTGPGANVLTVGFVIEGGNSKRVLIRAVGPSLSTFGVTGFLSDPVLTLFSGGSPILSGSTVGTGPQEDLNLPAVFADVGAFALNPGSDDMAMSPTLAPGAYTAQVTSLTGQSGVVLLEVYEVP